jgi:hypothetical protein
MSDSEKRQRRRRRAHIGLAVFGLFVAAYIVAPPYLARRMYDTSVPTRNQIRTARVIIGAPVTVPFLLFIAWAWVNERRTKTTWRTSLERQPLDDATKRAQTDRG